MSLTIEDIEKIIPCKIYGRKEYKINKIVTDSRNQVDSTDCLFIAIKGKYNDGIKYIEEEYKKGVRSFIINENIDYHKFADACFIKVENSITALQQLAAYKRNLYNIPIIGITGSNGKTIVKEWLSWILNEKFNLTKNPKSYNSQIGVPLSVWHLNNFSELGIFEAGISQPDEMKNLEKIIRPTIGILTNIGTAHQANFSTIEQKIKEKLLLFQNSETLIYNCDDELINLGEKKLSGEKKIITWSKKNTGIVNITKIVKKENKTQISFIYKGKENKYEIPFIDNGSIENSISCICAIIALNLEFSADIIERFGTLPSVKMRLEVLEGIYNSILISDIYNSDFNSIEIALDYLNQKKVNRETVVILSDFLQHNTENTYENVKSLIEAKKIVHFIGIGEKLFLNKEIFAKNHSFYRTTEEFLKNIDYHNFHNKIVLIKGARDFKFEEITKKLQAKNNESTIEIDLSMLKQNLDYFKSRLNPNTKIIAMVKAFGYGNGHFEISNLLQHNNIDYLAVAIVDEGVELRDKGISLPIMVMNPAIHYLRTMIEYKLEPEIYSIALLTELMKELEISGIKNFQIHLKIDTGMHRLGISEKDVENFCNILKSTDLIKITSIFSHLVGSDDKKLDYFTQEQVSKFNKIYFQIVEKIGYKPDRHVLNSAGIIRFPEYDYEMVRLGIGLYGLMPEITDKIFQISTFVSIISQIHEIEIGETVSYSRSGKILRNSTIATIPVGYADGLDRRLGNGNWYFVVNGQKAKTIGNICMDMTMIDITDIQAKEGDEVIIFGKENSICKMAETLGTIPYEIITGISLRIKRVYSEE
ncbi:MAG: bifunctional UDP-N-acetylmuramoyl-tripeptide:D-alanyl-D-alanine ligase/alanine racemase [Bacteroidales bacterium]|jgi:alanine racemase|nr:bifunctional UDP-N-acetylmuramoyl-tripeptide:D-alanyl-D-alanine ligase/alanine racemase [Bacteroidales bacterium]